MTTAPSLPPGSVAPPVAADTPLVEVVDLVKHFPVRGGILQRQIGLVQAVDGVSFTIRRGETLGLVGESGCGKTTVGRLLLRLIDPTSGTILFDGKDITAVRGAALKPYRRRMQIIFQDPYASLDPRTPIGDSIGEGLRIHGLGTAAERREKVSRMMDMVGLQQYHARRYPHEFSGGQRQRIGIARALVLEPDLVVCDEPVSALDVSIQAQVLNLLNSLQRELGLTYMFVAHNMGVVEHISDRVAVMYLGRIAELADRRELFHHQEHPYTAALMSSIPVPDPEIRRQRVILTGDVPSPVNPPRGCRFHPRCPLRAKLGDPEICAAEVPPLIDLGAEHLCACHFRQPGEAGAAGGPSGVAGLATAPGVAGATMTPGSAGATIAPNVAEPTPTPSPAPAGASAAVHPSASPEATPADEG